MKVKWASEALSKSIYLAVEKYLAFNVLPPEATTAAELDEKNLSII